MDPRQLIIDQSLYKLKTSILKIESLIAELEEGNNTLDAIKETFYSMFEEIKNLQIANKGE